MKTNILSEEEYLTLCDLAHNPPTIRDQREQNLFQAEIRARYNRLIESLSAFGEEGDLYGISDFAIRPTLREWPTLKPPPESHNRRFWLTIISKKFYKRPFLQETHKFLTDSPMSYQVAVSQDFDPNWSLRMFLTRHVAHVFCTNPKEMAKIQKILATLT